MKYGSLEYWIGKSFQWIRERIFYFLVQGKCPKCGYKLNMTALGVYNCAKCFRKYTEKYFGRRYDNDDIDI